MKQCSIGTEQASEKTAFVKPPTSNGTRPVPWLMKQQGVNYGLCIRHGLERQNFSDVV